MRTYLALIMGCVFTVTPVYAGALSFTNGQTDWRSTQCVRPASPASIRDAHPETAGDDMNQLMGQHNDYVAAAENYMDCVGKESEQDQTLLNQSITKAAQKEISDMQDAVANDMQSIPSH